MSGAGDRRWSWAVLAAAALCPGAARGDGLLLAPSDLGPARPRIEGRMAADRARHPALWRQVAGATAVDGTSGQLQAARRSRSQRPEAVGVRLRRMGAAARFALVDLLAFHAPERGAADDASWHALQLAVVDALGVSPDPELAPALEATFTRLTDVDLTAAAAVGLGHLGDPGVSLLLPHAAAGDPRLGAAVRGLGASHRPMAVEALARLLDATRDERLAQALSSALAEAGSSWAWSTGRLGSAVEGEQARRQAAAALVRNYPRFSGLAVPAVEIALRRVSHPDTAALIADSRRIASPAAAVRLDRLAAMGLAVPPH